MPRGEKTKSLWKDCNYRNNQIKKRLGKKSHRKGISVIEEYGTIKGNEILLKNSNKHKGNILPKETKIKMKQTWEKKYNEGYINPTTGKKYSSQYKQLMSKRQKGKKGSNWKGGKSFEEYPQEFNKTLKHKIRKRDGFKCKECDYSEKKLGRKLSIHHIDYNKKNNNEDNLISLCISCYMQTNFKRNDWKNYFGGKLK